MKVVGRGETSTGTGKFYVSIDRSKVLTCYRRAYGSGYPGIAGKGTVGLGFPFFFWPLAFGTVGLGGAYHYHSDVGASHLQRGRLVDMENSMAVQTIAVDLVGRSKLLHSSLPVQKQPFASFLMKQPSSLSSSR